MTEKNILAYFKNPEDAEGIAAKLQAMRAIDVSIDRISRYPGDPVQNVMNPITGNFSSLSSLTSDADVSNNAGILISADTSASGISDGGEGGVTGRNILLTAVVDEQIYEKALRLIQGAGGMV